MAILIKTKEEIDFLREGGKRHALILEKLSQKVVPGVSTKALDEYAEKLIREQGDIPAFLNYKPEGVRKAYPASLCVSLNEEVVHCIPKEDIIIQEGDIVSLDVGIQHQGMITDAAVTVLVGNVDKRIKELVRVTQEALSVGIAAARGGGYVGDIGHAIETFIKSQKQTFGIIRTLTGHGVGRYVHEDPYVPNFGKKGTGDTLKPGMVLALEPMITLGGEDITVDEDEYTITTKDGSISAHFEHTILITEGEAEVLTR